MKFTQISTIDFSLILFSGLTWLNQNQKGTITFKNGKISFLNIEWRGYLNKENELYLFGKKDEEIFRIRLYCDQGEKYEIEEFIAGELYQRIYKRDYELVALLKFEKVTESDTPFTFDNKFENWIIDCLYDMDLSSFKKDTFSESGNIEKLLEVLGIPTHYSKKFEEEGIDIEYIKYITDDEINSIFDKIGDRLKMRNYLKTQ
jgi:uncharacterized protein YkuJ